MMMFFMIFSLSFFFLLISSLHIRDVYVNNPSTEISTPTDVAIMFNTVEIISEINGCVDIHFRLVSNSQILNHFQEGPCSITETVFWVTIPVIPNGNNLLVQIEYGDDTISTADPFLGDFISIFNSGSCPGWASGCTADCPVDHYIRAKVTNGHTTNTRGSYAHHHNLAAGVNVPAGGIGCDSNWGDDVDYITARITHLHGTLGAKDTDDEDLIPSYYYVRTCESKVIKLENNQIVMLDSSNGITDDDDVDSIANMNEKFLKSAGGSGGSPGSNGGSNSHTHSFSSFQTGTNAIDQGSVGYGTTSEYTIHDGHYHNIYGNIPGYVDHSPPYYSFIMGENTRSRIPLSSHYFLVKSQIPTKGYTLLNNGIDNRFIRGSSSSYAEKLGTLTNHLHVITDMRTGATNGGGSDQTLDARGGSKSGCDDGHRHDFSGSTNSYTTGNGHVPSYFTVLVVKRKVSLTTTVADEDCGSDYRGSFCQYPRCFSFFADESGIVCSGLGTCSSVNICSNCGVTYSGDNCQCLIDFCENGGHCVNDTTVCSCVAGYEGDNCQCSDTKCQNGGHCQSSNICDCPTTHEGDNCQCSKTFCLHGSCVGVDETCVCKDDFYGDFCEISECYSVFSNETGVCSGHGNCTDYNKCECEEFYKLPICSLESTYCVPDCLFGTCNYFVGVCECQTDYFGDYCEHYNGTQGNNDIIIYISIGAGIVILALIVIIVVFVVLVTLAVKKVKSKSQLSTKDGFVELESQDALSPQLKVNLKLFLIPFEEIKLLKVLGTGGSNAVIYTCDWKGKKVAFKVFRTSTFNSQENFNEFEKELLIMSSINHPNIIQFFGASIKFPRIGIVYELCNLGDIEAFFSDGKNRITFQQKLGIMIGIINGIDFLHSRSIIHRDIKPSNILLTDDLTPKIIDFGLSRIFQKENEKKTTRVGTKFYMSPEVFIGSTYSTKADIFSASIVLYQIITLEFTNPYGGDINDNIEMKVSMDTKFRPKFRNNEPMWLQNLLRSMWTHNPGDRPTASAVKNVLTVRGRENKGGNRRGRGRGRGGRGRGRISRGRKKN